METPETIRTSLQQGEWVTSVDFKDAYFHIPIQEQSRKYLRFHVQGRTYQFRALPFGLSTAPMEFTVVAKEVKLMATRKVIRIHQYLDDWLVRATTHRTCLQHTQTLVKICQDLGWLVNVEKSELEPKQVFDFVGYQFDLRSGRVRPTPDRWQSLQEKIRTLLSLPACLVRQLMSLIGLLTATEKQVHLGRLHMRPIQWHLKNNWRVPEIFRKGYPPTHVLAPPPTMVAGGRQCAPRTSLTPFATRSADIYRRIKRRVGRSLKRAHCKRPLVGAGKQSAHKLPGTESSLPSLKRIPRSLYRKDSSSGNRQHHSGGIYKQGRRHEVRPSLCPIVENLDLVFPETSDAKSPPHSRSSQCDSGQVIQTGSDHPDRVVPPPRDLSEDMQQMAPASNRSLCNEIQPQVTSVCISSTGPPGYSSGCTHSTMGGPGCLCLPTYSHLGQSGGETAGLPLSETHSDRSGVAQHALVLGLNSSVQPDSSQPAQSVDAALQSDPSHEPVKSKSPCVAP